MHGKKKFSRIKREIITADPREWEDYMDVEKYLEEIEKPPHFLAPIKTNIGSEKHYSPEAWKKCFTSPEYIDCEDPLDWEEYSNVKFVSGNKSLQRSLTKAADGEGDMEMKWKMNDSVTGEMLKTNHQSNESKTDNNNNRQMIRLSGKRSEWIILRKLDNYDLMFDEDD